MRYRIAPAGLLTAIVLISVSVSVGRAASSGSWSWQNPLPQGNNLTAVACPDAHTCYAVGNDTIMTSHDGGQSWTSTFDRALEFLPSLACPGPSTCYALAENGSRIIGTTNGGATWKDLFRVASFAFNAISCPEARTCVASALDAQIFVRTTDGGQHWSRRHVDFRPVTVDCPVAATCYAPINTSLIRSPPPSVAVSADGGTTWTLKQVGIEAQLWAIACPSSLACSVYAFAGQLGDTPVFLTTRDGGHSWAQHTFPVGTYLRGGALACPTASTCYIAAGNGTAAGLILATSDGGARWSLRTRKSGQILGLACVGRRQCVAVGGAGTIERTQDGWVRWNTVSRNAARRLAVLGPGIALHAISCPAVRVCYAAGDRSSFIATSDAGQHWHARDGLQRSHVLRDLSTLSCPGRNVCFAGSVAQYPPGSGAMAFVTRDGGRSWRANPGAGFAAIACPSASICYAGGEHGAMRVSHNGGRTWTALRTPLAGSPYTITTLTCPSTAVCYAGALGPSEPPPHPEGNVGALLSTSNGGRTWTRKKTDPYPAAVACSTRSDCFALSEQTDRPQNLVTHDAGRTWRRYRALPSGIWDGMTCASGRTCYAAGFFGNIAVSRDAGVTWTLEETPTGNPLYGVRCTGETECYTVGEYGTVLHGS